MIVTPRNQPPVPVEDRPERPHRLSFTWLSHFARCKRSALLYTQFGGGPASHEMERGSVVHECIARLTNECIERSENTVPFDLAKAVLAEVYAEARYTVDPSEWDYMRQCVYHWARYTVIDPDEVLGVEQLLVWDVGDWRISGKVDLAWAAGETVAVRDYKTARWPQSFEDFKESAQTKLYSLLLAYGKPVTISECECQGTGKLLVDMGDAVSVCPFCEGKGHTETVEPHSLGESAQHFHVSEVYPGVVWDRDQPTERMASREHTLSRAELLDEKMLVESLLAQVSETFETGQWDAVPGDDQCGKCPARRACPLPAVLLPAPGLIETPEEAEHYATASFFLEAEKKEVDKALKAYAVDHEPPQLNDDEVYAVVQEKKTSIDRKRLAEDLANRTASTDLEDYIVESFSNRFRRRKRSEQAEAPEATNGVLGSSPAEDVEAARDEKFGESLPA